MGGFNPGQMQNLIAQAKQQYEDLQKKMQATVVDFSSGGGGVTVKMNGRKELLSITIDPEIVKSGDVEMIQDLVTAAVNQALVRARQAAEQSITSAVGNLPIAGLSGLLGPGGGT